MSIEWLYVSGTLLGLEDTPVSKTDVGLPYMYTIARWCDLMGNDNY